MDKKDRHKAKQERLAQALRDNLKRRKQQKPYRENCPDKSAPPDKK